MISKKTAILLGVLIAVTGCTTAQKKTNKNKASQNQIVSQEEQPQQKAFMRPVLADRLGMKDQIYTPKRMEPAIAGTLNKSNQTLAYNKPDIQIQPDMQSFLAYQGQTIAPNNREKECLARAMYFEARVIDHASLMAVGTVMANRHDSKRFPNSFCDVASQSGQFTSNPLERKISKEELSYATTVAEQIMQGIRYPGFHGVYYFRTSNTPLPDKDKIQIVGDIGGNTFFKY